MDKVLSEFLEAAELRKGLTDVAASVAEEVASEAAKDFLKRFGSGVAAAAADEILKGVMGIFAKALLKHFLGLSDSLTAKLNELVREPYETGMRVIFEALFLPAETQAESSYRETLLREGITLLERAWTHAKGRTAKRDRFVIRLVQGLAAAQLPGGQKHAQSKMSYCLTALAEARNHAEEQAAKLLKTVRTEQDAVFYYKSLWGKPHEIRKTHPDDDTASVLYQ